MTSMDCDHLRHQMVSAISDGWSCTTVRATELLVVSPLSFPDGDHPEILVAPMEGGLANLSDFGQVQARLRTSGFSFNPEAPRSAIERTARGYGVQWSPDYDLSMEVPADDVGRALFDFASAMIAIDALVALRTPPRPPMFSDTFATFVESQFDNVEKKFEVSGRTGGRYVVDVAIQEGGRWTLLQAISARGAGDAASINRTFRTWYEVKDEYPRRITVLESPADAYRSSDVALLTDLSKVGVWDFRSQVADFVREGDFDSESQPLLYDRRPRLPE